MASRASSNEIFLRNDEPVPSSSLFSFAGWDTAIFGSFAVGWLDLDSDETGAGMGAGAEDRPHQNPPAKTVTTRTATKKVGFMAKHQTSIFEGRSSVNVAQYALDANWWTEVSRFRVLPANYRPGRNEWTPFAIDKAVWCSRRNQGVWSPPRSGAGPTRRRFREDR